MPGMRTSMITTSGLRRSASSTARRAVGGLADDADVRRAREREAQALAHDLVVVDDQRGDLVRHGARILCRKQGKLFVALRRAQRTRPAVADAVLLREAPHCVAAPARASACGR